MDDRRKASCYMYFQHNFLHFFIRTLKLSNEDQHHLPSVVVGRQVVHERYQVANGLQECSQTLGIMERQL